MNRLIVYGDIHGCFDEFISLRKKVNIQDSDIEVCVGDIITKGKDSIKTLDFIVKNGIKSVLGNHEDKIIRYLNHEKSNKKNPIVLNEDEQNIVSNLSKDHIEYLEQMPIFLKFKDITVLHGGLQNHMNLEELSKRDIQKLLRMRYLDQDQNFLSLGSEDESSVFWADIYNGKQGFIVYGHSWSKELKKSKFALGMDTGCVYGNKLSAVCFDDLQAFKYDIYQISKL